MTGSAETLKCALSQMTLDKDFYQRAYEDMLRRYNQVVVELELLKREREVIAAPVIQETDLKDGKNQNDDRLVKHLKVTDLSPWQSAMFVARAYGAPLKKLNELFNHESIDSSLSTIATKRLGIKPPVNQSGKRVLFRDYQERPHWIKVIDEVSDSEFEKRFHFPKHWFDEWEKWIDVIRQQRHITPRDLEK